MKWLRSLTLLVALGACAFPTYEDPAIAGLDPSQFAVVDNRWVGCPFCIDKIVRLSDDALIINEVNQEAFHLAPGSYRINARYSHHKISRRSISAVVDLKAGHRYAFKTQACYLLCFRMKFYSSDIWFRDLTTGEWIAGCRQGMGCA